jgi:hypothetical protein
LYATWGAPDARVDVERTLQAVKYDLKLQLADSGNDDLAGRWVGRHPQRRILANQHL